MSETKKAAKAEAETAAATTKAKAAAAETAAAAEPVAYMGPDIKNVAINGTVYNNGLPDALQKKIGEIPAIKGLVIPISGLAAAGAAIRTEGTALCTLYKAVSGKLKEQ